MRGVTITLRKLPVPLFGMDQESLAEAVCEILRRSVMMTEIGKKIGEERDWKISGKTAKEIAAIRKNPLADTMLKQRVKDGTESQFRIVLRELRGDEKLWGQTGLER